ncbi:dUTP diphosphatase [Lentilactobacillus hilgardii]|uniref:dUTP diphosphatase n=1 Tax=Lentilactobacillus hilgardii TaxID=1588 RepID=UPI0021A74D24|nr:dUTP diphosphatase [Lentilactobacillus hilgardii]MCT3395880.1 dUTP diphosphatase [Lentilactobacillus hilgardii]
MPKVFLKYKKMTASAIAPHKVHTDDTGFGLYADQTVYFAPFETKRVSLGISIQLNKGYLSEIRPEPEFTIQSPAKCIQTIIGNGYHDEIMAIFVNLSNQPNQINKGDKVCQLVIRRDTQARPVECGVVNESDRND